jgi:hypothetical protein
MDQGWHSKGALQRAERIPGAYTDFLGVDVKVSSGPYSATDSHATRLPTHAQGADADRLCVDQEIHWKLPHVKIGLECAQVIGSFGGAP